MYAIQALNFPCTPALTVTAYYDWLQSGQQDSHPSTSPLLLCVCDECIPLMVTDCVLQCQVPHPWPCVPRPTLFFFAWPASADAFGPEQQRSFAADHIGQTAKC